MRWALSLCLPQSAQLLPLGLQHRPGRTSGSVSARSFHSNPQPVSAARSPGADARQRPGSVRAGFARRCALAHSTGSGCSSRRRTDPAGSPVLAPDPAQGRGSPLAEPAEEPALPRVPATGAADDHQGSCAGAASGWNSAAAKANAPRWVEDNATTSGRPRFPDRRRPRNRCKAKLSPSPQPR